MNSKESSEKFLKDSKADIKSDQVAKGIKASGKSADSLKDYSTNEGGTLTGSAYFQQQISGRGPGKAPPVADILAWIRYKGLQTDIKPESLAYLISRKIAREGTAIFRGERPGLDLDGIVGRNKEELVKNLLRGTISEIKSALRGAINK